MKLIVKNVFRDKIDGVTVYQPGSVIEIKDPERAKDLIGRKLCEEFKPQPKGKKD